MAFGSFILLRATISFQSSGDEKDSADILISSSPFLTVYKNTGSGAAVAGVAAAAGCHAVMTTATGMRQKRSNFRREVDMMEASG